MSVGYISRIISGASFKRLGECINEVHDKSGKSKILTFFDIVGCAFKYGAGYFDYTIFEFYNMNSKERKTYMTRVKNKKLLSMMNDKQFIDVFEHKNLFDARFKDYIKRDFLDLSLASKSDLENFIKDKKEIVCKPSVGECGKGIEILKVDDFKDIDELYNYVNSKEKNFGVLEEKIKQHHELDRLYPYSVNCFRMVTLVKDGVPYVLYAVLKTGNHGKFVDNLENGGYACHFNLETGEVSGPGHTSGRDIVEEHPMTHVKFIGFKVPYVKEAMELCKKAALEVKEIKYVGWDVCITENGPAIVEGNVFTAYDFGQLPDYTFPKVGLLKKIQDLGVKL